MKNALVRTIAYAWTWNVLWSATEEIQLPGSPVHLRSGSEPEWAEYAGRVPHGDRLDLDFDARANDSESTLFIQQDDVRNRWKVELNGRRLADLHLMEANLVETIRVPGGTLREGSNTLSIVPPSENDDVFIHEIRLDPRPLDQALGGSELAVHSVDEESRTSVPCRVTVVDENGALAALKSTVPSRDAFLAVRPGVVYTGDGRVAVSLKPGEYTVYATRGPEYGVEVRSVHLRKGESAKLEMSIGREVSTPGWAACDTHVHTFTHSRHGDATINERMLTLAGEGIELPVSTDHNLHIDYTEASRTIHVDQYFTPITGNEVTTAKGHFNVFPTIPDARVPDFRVTHWPTLMEIFRATPDLRVIVLNHPRNVHNGFQRTSTRSPVRTCVGSSSALMRWKF
jgi:hypothetical protein